LTKFKFGSVVFFVFKNVVIYRSWKIDVLSSGF